MRSFLISLMISSACAGSLYGVLRWQSRSELLELESKVRTISAGAGRGRTVQVVERIVSTTTQLDSTKSRSSEVPDPPPDGETRSDELSESSPSQEDKLGFARSVLESLPASGRWRLDAEQDLRRLLAEAPELSGSDYDVDCRDGLCELDVIVSEGLDSASFTESILALGWRGPMTGYLDESVSPRRMAVFLARSPDEKPVLGGGDEKIAAGRVRR